MIREYIPFISTLSEVSSPSLPFLVTSQSGVSKRCIRSVDLGTKEVHIMQEAKTLCGLAHVHTTLRNLEIRVKEGKSGQGYLS